MKAIIPVAGASSRLRPVTYSQPKALIPVAGKPIMAYIIDQLLEAGIREFIFIVGYFGEKVETYVLKHYPGIDAHFVLQASREGIGHAVWQARKMADTGEELLIVLGDAIYDFDLRSVLSNPHSSLGIKKVQDPRHFGVAETTATGLITRVVEKPSIPKSNLAIVGVYCIRESKALFEALEAIITENARTKDEYQLTDAIMIMIEKGIPFHSFPVENWFDCGKKETLLETNSIMLKRNTVPAGFPPFENTIIVPPVAIAPTCRISNSIIGPNVTIGEESVVNYSIIKDSIIGDFATINDTTLYNSVIGGDAMIRGVAQSLNVGDNTEIDFS